MNRAYYSNTIENFLVSTTDEILGRLSFENEFNLESTQKDAWIEEIKILKKVLLNYEGQIYFEYSIPRVGQRIDVLLIIESTIFVLEFKVGEKNYPSFAIDQVTDYALDLKNFHETSHDKYIVPILISTNAKDSLSLLELNVQEDKLFQSIKTNPNLFDEVIKSVLQQVNFQKIDINKWETGRYQPTPTIVEAAMALYNNHSVKDLTRTDASAINLTDTSETI